MEPLQVTDFQAELPQLFCGSGHFRVYFERPPKTDKPASAGFYNSQAFNKLTEDLSSKHLDINGDAFSKECKLEVLEKSKEMGGAFDLVIYSLASPRRTDPESGQTYRACLKPIDAVYRNKSLDTDKEEVKEISLDPASIDEIESTRKVMGGEDWKLWTEFLLKENLLAKGCTNTSLLLYWTCSYTANLSQRYHRKSKRRPGRYCC